MKNLSVLILYDYLSFVIAIDCRSSNSSHTILPSTLFDSFRLLAFLIFAVYDVGWWYNFPLIPFIPWKSSFYLCPCASLCMNMIKNCFKDTPNVENTKFISNNNHPITSH